MLRAFSLYVISCIRQPVAQELDKIHVLYARKFCRPTSGVVLKQSRYSASVERVLVYISRCVNKKKRNYNAGHDGFLLNCNIDCTRHTADLAI